MKPPLSPRAFRTFPALELTIHITTKPIQPRLSSAARSAPSAALAAELFIAFSNVNVLNPAKHITTGIRIRSNSCNCNRPTKKNETQIAKIPQTARPRLLCASAIWMMSSLLYSITVATGYVPFVLCCFVCDDAEHLGLRQTDRAFVVILLRRQLLFVPNPLSRISLCWLSSCTGREKRRRGLATPRPLHILSGTPFAQCSC